jgi:hypothetical protein
MQPSPNTRRVGIRIVTFEACSGFTHVTARRIAQPPKATFVTRLQPCRLPSRAARQLPDQSTIIWVESSSTDDSPLRGARVITDIGQSKTTLLVESRCGASFRDSICAVHESAVGLSRRPTRRSRRQLSGQDRSRQLRAVEVVHDPQRHFGTDNCRTAKGLFAQDSETWHSSSASAICRAGLPAPG